MKVRTPQSRPGLVVSQSFSERHRLLQRRRRHRLWLRRLLASGWVLATLVLAVLLSAAASLTLR